jgi:hypothetical protein
MRHRAGSSGRDVRSHVLRQRATETLDKVDPSDVLRERSRRLTRVSASPDGAQVRAPGRLERAVLVGDPELVLDACAVGLGAEPGVWQEGLDPAPRAG